MVLWFRNAEGELVAQPFESSINVLPSLLGCARDVAAGDATRIVPFRSGAAVQWVLIAGHALRVRVNGLPIDAFGLRVLAHKDEISVPGLGSVYYSTETPAEVVPFAGSAKPAGCGRCRQPILPSQPSVCCPSCRVWHHEFDDLKCWTYAKQCSCCSSTTDLDAGFSWVPEEN